MNNSFNFYHKSSVFSAEIETFISCNLLQPFAFIKNFSIKKINNFDQYLFVDIICLQLFKCLLNQLRAWSDPSIERI
jgi:hypothetical protein